MSHEVQDFDRQVLERSRAVPVVVDFWAPWCGPCKMLGPVLEGLARESGGQWDLVKVNTEDHPALSARHRISSIPAVKLFRNGEVVDEFVGFRPEAQIREWLQPHLGNSPAGDAADPDPLDQAAELIDNGQLADARPLLEGVLASDPTRHAARLLLAEILLTDEPARALELVAPIPADAGEHPHAQALSILIRATMTPEDSLPDDPLRAVVRKGLEAARHRDWETALVAFIEVTERRRSFAGGLAAEAGKAIFRYLGIRHPIADRHYRRLSSALNS